MNTLPLISVIMSVYKEKIEWLRESIESILNQTFKDYEFIIICDNPSYKEGLECIEQYRKTDNRIKLIINEHNIGLTKSLNKGLTIARGKYIARMDADDTCDNSRFEKQVNILEHNKNIGVCSSLFRSINEKGNIIERGESRRCRSIIDLFIANPIAHSSVMFRKSLMSIRTPLYNESYLTAQDYELWAYLYTERIIFYIIPEVLLNYRISKSQISQRKGSDSCANTQKVRYDLIIRYLTQERFLANHNTNLFVLIDTIDNVFNRADNENKLVLERIMYSLYFTVSTISTISIIQFIFNRNHWIFKFSIRNSLHIILQRFRKLNTPLPLSRA